MVRSDGPPEPLSCPWSTAGARSSEEFVSICCCYVVCVVSERWVIVVVVAGWSAKQQTKSTGMILNKPTLNKHFFRVLLVFVVVLPSLIELLLLEPNLIVLAIDARRAFLQTLSLLFFDLEDERTNCLSSF